MYMLPVSIYYFHRNTCDFVNAGLKVRNKMTLKTHECTNQ